MRTLFALSIGLVIGTLSFSQTSDEVSLDWKINSDETLTYLTLMNEIDTSEMEFNFSNLFKKFADSSEDNSSKVKDLLKQLNDSFKNIDLISELTNNGNGTIELIMKTRPQEEGIDKTDSKDDEVSEMIKKMQSMNRGIMLRGSIYETGGIHSFWVKSNQKNLIALFFELPTKPVKVGDSWELDVDLIANDQNFECDSAYKLNKVTLIDLKKTQGETIAVLKYEIEEFVVGSFNASFSMENDPSTPTMMKFKHQAIAEFSVEKGRWISYDGIMGLEATGFMSANIKKSFALIDVNTESVNKE